MHKGSLCHHAVSVRPSVRVSVTFVDHVKTNKHIFEIFPPSGGHTILVIPYQMGRRYSDRNPLTGASNAGGVGKKRDSGRISGFAAYGSTVLSTYESRSMKNKAATNGGKRRAFTAASVVDPLFTQEDDEVFVTGSTLYAGDEGRSNPPWS